MMIIINNPDANIGWRTIHKLIINKFNLQLKASGLLKVVQQFPLEHKGPQY